MTKFRYYLLIIIVATYLLPSIPGLPLTPTAFFYLPLWFLVIFIDSPTIFYSQGFKIAYLFGVFHLTYLLFSFYPLDKDNDRNFYTEMLPLMFSFSVIEYYQNKKNDSEFSFFINFSFACILLTSITSTIGLFFFPNAARDLAGALMDNKNITAFYNIIGIAGFYFYAFIAIASIVCLYTFLKSNNRKLRYKLLAVYLIIFLTLIMSQYAASLSIFFIGLFVTLIYFYSRSFTKIILLIFTAIVLYFNISRVILVIVSFADVLEMEELSPRLKNIAYKIEGKEVSVSDEELQYEEIYNDLKKISIDSFKSNILTGGGKIGDHVFWYDLLGNFGLLGLVPWLFVFYYLLFVRVKIFEDDFKVIYILSVLLFAYFGFHKPYRAFETIPYIAIFLPFVTLYFQNLYNKVQFN
jgi:hypothetical protein